MTALGAEVGGVRGVKVEEIIGFFWLRPLGERKAVLFVRHRKGAGRQLLRHQV